MGNLDGSTLSLCVALIGVALTGAAGGETEHERRTNEANRLDAATGAVAETIRALDSAYQRAVLERDLATMDRILADDFALVTGKGAVHSKREVIESVAAPDLVYERQEPLQQTVRVWGDTAVVTALLWAKGSRAGTPFDYRLWYSDTYVRTPDGWRYVLGQAAQPLAE